MKTLRSLLAVAFASLALTSAAFASDAAKKEKACDCAKDKDGKVCGVDKDCCCTGKKAEKKEEKKS